MKFRKVLCGSLAALMALSTTAIVAQAEETAQFKLMTADLSKISDGNSYNFFGDGYLTDGKKFLRIGEEQIAEWSRTGKISAASVESDLDISGLSWWTGDFEGGYVQLVREDLNEKVTERYVVHLNKDSGKIETAYKLGADWCYTTSDGYTVLSPKSDVSGGTVSFTVMKPDGTNFVCTLNSWVAHQDGAKWDDYVWFKYQAVDDDKYCCYVVVDEKLGGQMTDERVYAVYAIDKQGSAVKLTGDIKANGCNFSNASGKNLAVSFVNSTGAFVLAISADSGKTQQFDYYGDIYYAGNSKIVGQRMGSSNCDLIDLNTGKSVAQYPGIQAVDDKLFLVITNEGKCAYINGSGKLLDTFDDADVFRGDYAPVVKNGKAYLIDRNMNRVSEMIDGSSVYSFMGGLYRVDNGENAMLMAYAKADDTPKPDDTSSEPTSSEPTSSEPTSSEPTSSEPTSSEPTSSEPTSSEPVSSDTASSGASGGNDNPNSGAAMALIPIALIGGAAVVVSKKRKR